MRLSCEDFKSCQREEEVKEIHSVAMYESTAVNMDAGGVACTGAHLSQCSAINWASSDREDDFTNSRIQAAADTLYWMFSVDNEIWAHRGHN
jgi:hypothetical protein